jgi:spermidine synthase
VPSVVKAFGYYHADAATVLHNPKGHIVVDDGRRFLRRTDQKYDVIVVDPPPPTWAAGSSLLYSTEFYALAKKHLKPGGILQMWYPGGELATSQAVVRSITESFPNVLCFPSIQRFGLHMLASEEPIKVPDAGELAAKMPESAKKDLMEWSGAKDVPTYLQDLLVQKADVFGLLNTNPEVQITDDMPFNEYFLLRQWYQKNNRH